MYKHLSFHSLIQLIIVLERGLERYQISNKKTNNYVKILHDKLKLEQREPH